MDVFNAAASLVSIILGGFSIWLSLHFYTKAKDAEMETKAALASIQAQSDALQRLTGKWMDRFTRHATEPRPADEAVMRLVEVVARLPDTVLSHIQIVSTKTNVGTPNADLFKELVDSYVGLYYYTAVANVSTQWLMPTEGEYDAKNDFHVGVATQLNKTSADFHQMEDVLNRLKPKDLQASQLEDLLRDAIAQWRPHVRNAAQYYTWARSAGDPK